MKPRHLENLVGSHPSSPDAAHRSGGFTLLEIQIAIMILALAMIGMIGHGRVYERVLDNLRSEHRFEGVALPGSNRVIVSVAQVGSDTSPPRCEVELETMEADGRMAALPKKEALKLRAEFTKLEKNLAGVRDMTELPSALFVIDTKRDFRSESSRSCV